MPYYDSPGVYTSERDLTNIVPGTATSSGAIVGQFNWGPVEKIQTVVSENQLVKFFGKPDENTYKSFFKAASFLAYSDNLKVLRVVGENARNATSGGDGTGLTLDTVAVNGKITSVSINNPGSNYIAGDIVLIDSTVTDAVVRVTSVDNNGAVLTVNLLSGGQGLTTATNVPTQVLQNQLIKNEDDFSDELHLPEAIAKYPGVLGNSLTVSIVNASLFDKWAFRDRFVIPPGSDNVFFSGDGETTTFTLPAELNGVLPSDAVVTVNGFIRKEGVDPGQYQVSGGDIIFNTDTETFTGDDATKEFTLANVYSLDTSEAILKVDGIKLSRYTGVSDVPKGFYRVTGNLVEVGVRFARFDGDGVTGIFKILGVNGINDAKVTVDGVQKTVITSGVPNSGEVLVIDDGADTKIEFPVGEEPASGSNNILIEWDFIDPGSVVTVEYGAPHNAKNSVKIFWNQNEVHVAIIDVDGKWSNGEENTLLERYDALSTIEGHVDPEGNGDYYVERINRESELIWIGTPWFEFGSKRLSGGVDANSSDDVDDSVLQFGWDFFKNPEDIEVFHLIVGDASVGLINYVTSVIADNRRESVAYFSPPLEMVFNNRGKEADEIAEWTHQLNSTSYGTIDGNWKYILDPYNKKKRWIPCAGDHAGIYALTHERIDPWFPAAGLNRGRIKNAIKLAWNPDQTSRDILYSNRVNPIIWEKGDGPVMFGDKTMLSKPSAFDRLNVRWLFIVLRKSIAKSSKYFLFELNDPFTRNQFVNMVNPFLRDVKSRRGVYDYRVVCDETNNTPTVIDRNEFIADIFIKPARSINFIQLNFIATPTGLNFEEIIQSENINP